MSKARSSCRLSIGKYRMVDHLLVTPPTHSETEAMRVSNRGGDAKKSAVFRQQLLALIDRDISSALRPLEGKYADGNLLSRCLAY